MSEKSGNLSRSGEEWDRLSPEMKAEFNRFADAWYAGWSHKGRDGFRQALAKAYELGAKSSEISSRDSIIEECAQAIEGSWKEHQPNAYYADVVRNLKRKEPA